MTSYIEGERRLFDSVTYLLLLKTHLTTPPKMQVMMSVLMNLKIFLRSHLSLNDVDLPGDDFNPVNGAKPQPLYQHESYLYPIGPRHQKKTFNSGPHALSVSMNVF